MCDFYVRRLHSGTDCCSSSVPYFISPATPPPPPPLYSFSFLRYVRPSVRAVGGAGELGAQDLRRNTMQAGIVCPVVPRPKRTLGVRSVRRVATTRPSFVAVVVIVTTMMQVGLVGWWWSGASDRPQHCGA